MRHWTLTFSPHQCKMLLERVKSLDHERRVVIAGLVGAGGQRKKVDLTKIPFESVKVLGRAVMATLWTSYKVRGGAASYRSLKKKSAVLIGFLDMGVVDRLALVANG